MKLRDQAAVALDATHLHAQLRIGIYTDSARDTIAKWLDGRKVKIRYIRALVRYLESLPGHSILMGRKPRALLRELGESQ